MLALNAAGPLTVIRVTLQWLVFNWSLPTGYYEGFIVTAIPGWATKADCEATVYGMNNASIVSDCVYLGIVRTF